jgi:ribosome-associated protein
MRIVLTLANYDSPLAMAKKKKPRRDTNSNDDLVAEIDQDLYDEVSKSALKRESDAKQKLGESLALLTNNQIEELDLNDDLRRAVEDLKRLLSKGSRAHGGMKRQKQYIGKLMRYTEVEPIQAKIDEWQNASDAGKVFLHRMEQWRDRILKDGDHAIEEMYTAFSIKEQSHRQNLRQFHRQANKEKASNKAPKSARLLFKFLRDEVFSEHEENLD